MSLDSLYVLHIYHYSKPKGQRCPLKNFITRVKPLSISTCMRHIYIFQAEQLNENKESLAKLINTLENTPKHQAPSKYQLIQGAEAYSLLLYWAVGGLNNKNQFDDSRNLGDIRKTLYNLEHSQSINIQKSWQINQSVATALRRDAKYLLLWVQSLSDTLKPSEKIEQVMLACDLCASAREQGWLRLFTKFDYQYFASKQLMIEHLKYHIETALDKINKEQQRIYNSEGQLGLLFSMSNIHLQKRKEQLLQLRSKIIIETPQVDVEAQNEDEQDKVRLVI